MLRTTVLILLSLAWGLSESVAADNIALANRLSTALQELRRAGKIKTQEFDIAVKDGDITLTGQVSSRAEAAVIAETIFKDEDVVEVHLNLALGRRPSEPRTTSAQRMHWFTEAHRQPLVWDDGLWESRFSVGYGPHDSTRPQPAESSNAAPKDLTEKPASPK